MMNFNQERNRLIGKEKELKEVVECMTNLLENSEEKLKDFIVKANICGDLATMQQSYNTLLVSLGKPPCNYVTNLSNKGWLIVSNTLNSPKIV